ncbi:MAG: hypothetical protein ACRDS9_16335, partial [Pseudonocardiaceae bacterium]
DQDLLAFLVAEPPMPYTEISRRLGVPLGSIGPIRARCFARLRRELATLGVKGGPGAVNAIEAPTGTADPRRERTAYKLQLSYAFRG